VLVGLMQFKFDFVRTRTIEDMYPTALLSADPSEMAAPQG
jgi:hypothetical protein